MPSDAPPTLSRRWVRASILAAVGLSPSSARADDAIDTLRHFWISPGVVGSWSTTPSSVHGFGFELSGGWATRNDDASLGGVYRTQGYSGDGSSFRRETYAFQATYMLIGVEAGWARRGAMEGEGAKGGFHVSPFLTAAFLYVGPQVLVPMEGGRTEVQLNIGLKLPLTPKFFTRGGIEGMMAGGRPLFVAGRVLLASLRGRADWIGTSAPPSLRRDRGCYAALHDAGDARITRDPCRSRPT